MEKNRLREISVQYSAGSFTKIKIQNSMSAYKLFLESWNSGTIELQEEFKMLLLNRSNGVLGIYTVSKGGVSGTLVDPKLVFAVALKCNASGIIFAHNHPSGNLKPSGSDKTLTRKLKAAAKLLDIEILDHLVITKSGYLSFSDQGILHA